MEYNTRKSVLKTMTFQICSEVHRKIGFFGTFLPLQMMLSIQAHTGHRALFRSFCLNATNLSMTTRPVNELSSRSTLSTEDALCQPAPTCFLPTKQCKLMLSCNRVQWLSGDYCFFSFILVKLAFIWRVYDTISLCRTRKTCIPYHYLGVCEITDKKTEPVNLYHAFMLSHFLYSLIFTNYSKRTHVPTITHTRHMPMVLKRPSEASLLARREWIPSFCET